MKQISEAEAMEIIIEAFGVFLQHIVENGMQFGFTTDGTIVILHGEKIMPIRDFIETVERSAQNADLASMLNQKIN